jgi:UDP-N-acetylglucosamine:LPS N-acetylglucosamine transferase
METKPTSEHARKVLVVSSNGGHFDVAAAVFPAFRDWDVELVYYRLKGELAHVDLEALAIKRVHHVSLWGNTVGFRLAASFCFNFLEAFVILLRSRPQVIFSTGAEIAIPVALVGRFLFGARLIHLETAVHPRKVSLTGRLLHPFCHRFFVQWPEARTLIGGKAEYAGRVF